MSRTSTILIVDDEAVGRETLAALLHTQGYQLAFASDGPSALAQAAAVNPDVILLDVMMPGMDGFEVCQRLRATPGSAEVPIIIITALDDRASRLQGIEAGADDFISKPFDRIELRTRINALMRLNRYRRLLHERAMFERLVDLSPNGLLIVDAEGQICLANPAMRRLLRLDDPDRLTHATLWQIVAPGEQAKWRQQLADVFGAQANIRFESLLYADGGVLIPAEADIAPLEWHQQPAAQIIVRDISERKHAEALAQRQIEQLSALRTINIAIASSFDIHAILEIIAEQACSLLHMDACAILLRKPPAQQFEYVVVRGVPRSALQQTSLRPGEGYGGYVALHGQPLRLPSATADTDSSLPTFDQRLTAYYGIPLMVKGQVEGVLEIYHHEPLDRQPEALNFLESLAEHAALALDRMALFESMQNANIELGLAYDATLEGWARALELRDIETEGHSRRVTHLTVRLAQAMGIGDADLVHVRRGALLHDIGKMGIPDSILLKPGPLTADEWVVMRKHPQYAYDMLTPITYFRPALDIPYYHHEKWDGTGYPHGLRGEQIPLAARIFAIVDVWDALRFDRPYRKGWPEDEVREHIRSLAGTHFDPQVVQAFMKLDRAEETDQKPAILVVDDNEGITFAIARGLHDLFRVYTAMSGEDALEVLEREEIAVIITDQRMPGMTGVELLARAQQIRPATLGLLSSAYVDQVAQASAYQIQTVRGFLPKPWNLIELRRQVSDIAQQYQQSSINAEYGRSRPS